MVEQVKEYCFGCGDPIYDGEFVYWCDPHTGEELAIGGKPFHDDCSVPTFFIEPNKADEEL